MKRSHVSVDYSYKRDAKLQVLEVIEQLEFASLQNNDNENRMQRGQKPELHLAPSATTSSSSSSSSSSVVNDDSSSTSFTNCMDSVSFESMQSSQDSLEFGDSYFSELIDVWNESLSISILGYSIIREGGSADTASGSGGSTSDSSPQHNSINGLHSNNGFTMNSNPVSSATMIESPMSPYTSYLSSSSSSSTSLSQSTTLLTSHKKKKYTVFTIQVSCPKKTWFIYRRYNDFRDLSSSVCKHWSNLPALPPKNIFFNSNFSPDFLRKRQSDLNNWLNILVKERGMVKKVYEIRQFLSNGSNNPPDGVMQPTLMQGINGIISNQNANSPRPILLPLATPITTPNHTPPASPNKKQSEEHGILSAAVGSIEFDKNNFFGNQQSLIITQNDLFNQNGLKFGIQSSPPSAPISMKQNTPNIAISKQLNGSINPNLKRDFNHYGTSQLKHDQQNMNNTNLNVVDDEVNLIADEELDDTSDDEDMDGMKTNSEDINLDDAFSIEDEEEEEDVEQYDDSKESLPPNFNMAAPTIKLLNPNSESTTANERNASHDAAQDLLFLSSASTIAPLPMVLNANTQQVINVPPPPQPAQFVSRHQLLHQNQPQPQPLNDTRLFGYQSPALMRSPPSLSNINSGLPPPTPLNINSIQSVGSTQNLLAKSNRLNARKVGMSDFEMVKVLGKGSFGKVILTKKKDTGALYAIKVLKKQYVVLRKQVQHTRTERSILGKIHHPFIVKLHYAFQTGDKLHFVLTYAPGGELFFHLGRAGRFSEELAKFYTAEISLALGYLHSKHVVYRDLKPENVLLDRDGHVLLADFGLSKEGIVSGIEGTHSFCGTPEYLAPEVLNRVGHGTAVDWWSLGALLYEMLTGLPPWYSQERKVLFAGIQRGTLAFPSYVSPSSQSILKDLLQRDPALRLGSRNGVDEVKLHPFFEGINWELLYAKNIKPPFCPCPTTSSSMDSERPRNESTTIDTRNFEDTFTRMPIDSVASNYNEYGNMLMHTSSTSSLFSNGQPRSFNEFAGFTYDDSANALDHIPFANVALQGHRTPPSISHFKRN